MRDEFDNEVTAGDILEGFEHDLENCFWPALADDSHLTAEDKGAVTRLMEEAEEAIRDARKITSGSPENE